MLWLVAHQKRQSILFWLLDHGFIWERLAEWLDNLDDYIRKHQILKEKQK